MIIAFLCYTLVYEENFDDCSGGLVVAGIFGGVYLFGYKRQASVVIPEAINSSCSTPTPPGTFDLDRSGRISFQYQKM
jgi:hypothetical protein